MSTCLLPWRNILHCSYEIWRDNSIQTEATRESSSLTPDSISKFFVDGIPAVTSSSIPHSFVPRMILKYPSCQGQRRNISHKEARYNNKTYLYSLVISLNFELKTKHILLLLFTSATFSSLWEVKMCNTYMHTVPLSV